MAIVNIYKYKSRNKCTRMKQVYKIKIIKWSIQNNKIYKATRLLIYLDI